MISRPDQYVGVTTYTGDGNSSGRRINIGFRPDLIWLKSRGSGNHGLYDSVRGPNKRLQSDDPAAEDTVVFPGASNFGFDFGSETYYNASSTNYVAWTWKAGGDAFTYNKDGAGGSSASDIGVSATTLTLTGASINTESKFGIYAYTGSGSGGATITHNLGGTPAFVIYKKRTGSTSSWQVYHQSLGGTKYMNLDEDTDAYTSDSTRFGGTDPTSTTITLGTHANGAVTTILYAWCDVPGLQKFGSYNGNGNADGPFLELGFKPAIVWVKRSSSSTGEWRIWDIERDPINFCDNKLYANKSNAETGSSDTNEIDILSNGFKLRSSVSEGNANDETFIYCAWAAAPSIDLYGGGANAR